MEATRRASLTRPPPSARRSKTSPRAPCFEQPLDGVVELAVGAFAERGEVDPAELDAVDGAHRRRRRQALR